MWAKLPTCLTCGRYCFTIGRCASGCKRRCRNRLRNTTRYESPVAFVVNQIDHEKSKFNETINQLKESFGSKVTLVQYPVAEGEDFNAIIDLVLMKMLKYGPDGGEPEILDIPADEMTRPKSLK